MVFSLISRLVNGIKGGVAAGLKGEQISGVLL